MEIKYRGSTAEVRLSNKEFQYRANGLIQYLANLCEKIQWELEDEETIAITNLKDKNAENTKSGTCKQCRQNETTDMDGLCSECYKDNTESVIDSQDGDVTESISRKDMQTIEGRPDTNIHIQNKELLDQDYQERAE